MADPRPDQPRWPLHDLLVATRHTPTSFGRLYGLSGSSLRLAVDRGLSTDAAENWAARAGLPAYAVWPDMVSTTIDEMENECASTDCTTRFVPRDLKSQQRYCSDRCRLREKTRRYRATPTGAQKARDIRRRYYWSDPKIRAREAEVKARPSARRAEAARRRELRAQRREAA